MLESLFPNVTFGNSVQVLGVLNVAIGEGSVIGDDAWLNVCDRDEAVRLRIGSRVLVGRHSMISTGGYLEIGDFCVFAPRVYISDADHIFADIHRPILQQGATLGRSIVVEENCWFGINAVASGHLTVGRGSVIAANTVVTKDVPPFSVVAGNPARILKMYNPATNVWERTRTADEIAYLLDVREHVPIPTRTQLRTLLWQNAGFDRVDPLVAGRGQCI